MSIGEDVYEQSTGDVAEYDKVNKWPKMRFCTVGGSGKSPGIPRCVPSPGPSEGGTGRTRVGVLDLRAGVDVAGGPNVPESISRKPCTCTWIGGFFGMSFAITDSEDEGLSEMEGGSSWAFPLTSEEGDTFLR